MSVQALKYALLFSCMLFIRYSIAQEVTSDAIPEQIKKNAVVQSPQPDAIQQLYKKIREDSAAHSIAIQQLYKKMIEDSITHSAVPDALRFIRNIIGKTMIKQPTVTFDAGLVFSTYRFFDSQDNKLKDLTSISTTCFSLGYHYPFPDGLFLRTNMGVRKGGASMVFEGLHVNWNVQYASANVGLGYILNKKRFKPYFSASPYFGYMLKGTQIIGTDNYDIKKEKSMKTTDFGVFFSPGLEIALSNTISFYAEYNYILGLQNIEKPELNGAEPSTAEKLYNRGFSVNVGLAIVIEKPRPALSTKSRK